MADIQHMESRQNYPNGHGEIGQTHRFSPTCDDSMVLIWFPRRTVGTRYTWSNGIGFYINWNLALADPRDSHPLEYPLEEPSWIPEFRDGIIDPILPNASGQLQPFTRPGLGFEINPKMLKKYGRRFFKLTEFGLKIKLIREKGLKEALDLKKRKESDA